MNQLTSSSPTNNHDITNRRKQKSKRRRRARSPGAEKARMPDVQPQNVTGLLETHPDGYGFLRSPERNWRRQATDPFVSRSVITRFKLQQGDMVQALAELSRNEHSLSVSQVLQINDQSGDSHATLLPYDDRTPVSPRERLHLQTGKGPITMRVLDLLTPIGKGQRALIVAPPRTGKTTLLRHISQAIASNHPDCHLAVLLVDERPEEVTEFQTDVPAEFFASNLDQPFASHIRMANLAIDRCKRLAETGRDVVLVVDSLTRLARAFNKTIADGPIAQGGLRIRALEFPKATFGAARAFREGGSLTVIATALVGTSSHMDEAIFQELKGTGNLEVVLNTSLADHSIWPAIDISASRTRNEALLYTDDELWAALAIRRTLTGDDPREAMQRLTRQIERFDSNHDLVALVNAASAGGRLSD